MNLRQLLEPLLHRKNPSWEKVEIVGITSDSRLVKPGYLFIAIGGRKNHGFDHAKEAFDNGAVAMLTDAPKTGKRSRHVIVYVERGRYNLSRISSKFYTPRPETTVAVTGTNGKTSTVDFVRQIWERLGLPGASIGTLGVISMPYRASLGHTTPPADIMHRELMELAKRKIEYVALEASSHGIEQQRLDHIGITAAGFTNLTVDHLDYHKTMENYRKAKFRLFTEILAPGQTAVINADIPEYPMLYELCKKRQFQVIDYGRNANYLRITNIRRTNTHQYVDVVIPGDRKKEFETTIAGEFQIYNILCAIGLVFAKYQKFTPLFECIPYLKPVHGRLELVGRNQHECPVFVDYAHTPDALERVLNTLRPITKKRLIIIFGCGGNRDSTKRSMMGKIAKKLADITIVTDDNPRNEDPADIRQQIIAACPEAIEIDNRREAIQHGISLLKSGDVLLVAGKGHETGQIIGSYTLPFDDCEAVRTILSEG
ncbi:MAG: UDP-N-acetylmuramoyl-L-alanyl-D-glutamate--2,6-diaminopimelate ligase [Alphaproteobacteria bacterium]|nr:UDP-N-acetylmuramoyl-L-alanyl-D-glutamate--2,6-diaminopimelate ligase [Alphaproteobacteria bacterium]